jgi:hypothetical protein
MWLEMTYTSLIDIKQSLNGLSFFNSRFCCYMQVLILEPRDEFHSAEVQVGRLYKYIYLYLYIYNMKVHI